MSHAHERHSGPGPTCVVCPLCFGRTYRQARRSGYWRHRVGCKLFGKDPREQAITDEDRREAREKFRPEKSKQAHA